MSESVQGREPGLAAMTIAMVVVVPGTAAGVSAHVDL